MWLWRPRFQLIRQAPVGAATAPQWEIWAGTHGAAVPSRKRSRADSAGQRHLVSLASFYALIWRQKKGVETCCYSILFIAMARFFWTMNLLKFALEGPSSLEVKSFHDFWGLLYRNQGFFTWGPLRFVNSVVKFLFFAWHFIVQYGFKTRTVRPSLSTSLCLFQQCFAGLHQYSKSFPCEILTALLHQHSCSQYFIP